MSSVTNRKRKLGDNKTRYAESPLNCYIPYMLNPHETVTYRKSNITLISSVTTPDQVA